MTSLNPQWFYVNPPARVQAVRLTDNADWEAIAEWCGGELINYAVGDSGEYETKLIVPGPEFAEHGNWVLRGTTGHFFVCDNSAFAAAYSPEKPDLGGAS